ncbi:MAG TPA: DUF5678 domain-containing protein [Thermoanaerobaculia bacterium]|nr:DUF5678 domain-containing protein [Thermoanaerobaculia bacterium]
MGRALKIAPSDENERYVPRIKALVEEERIREARELVKEALRSNPSEPGLQGWSEVLAPAKSWAAPPGTGRDFDRTPELRWLEAHWQEYRGQWVALLHDELLAHGTLSEVMAQLREKPPEARPLLHRIH